MYPSYCWFGMVGSYKAATQTKDIPKHKRTRLITAYLNVLEIGRDYTPRPKLKRRKPVIFNIRKNITSCFQFQVSSGLGSSVIHANTSGTIYLQQMYQHSIKLSKTRTTPFKITVLNIMQHKKKSSVSNFPIRLPQFLNTLYLHLGI